MEKRIVDHIITKLLEAVAEYHGASVLNDQFIKVTTAPSTRSIDTFNLIVRVTSQLRDEASIPTFANHYMLRPNEMTYK